MLVAKVFLTAYLFWLSGESPAAIGSERLTITGSSTIAPLAMELARAYERAHGDKVRIDVQMGGSSKGISDTLQRRADIGMVSRALKPGEPLVAHTVAVDGIALVTHISNPINHLTKDQLLDIYQGKVTNWRQLGGLDRDISVVHKAAGRSTQEVFLGYLGVRNSSIRAAIIIGDNQQGIKTISGLPGSIGYVSIGSALSTPELGKSLKMLAIDGATPSYAAVKSGSYPIMRSLNFVTRDQPSGVSKRFLAFALSRKAGAIVKRQSFVPLSK